MDEINSKDQNNWAGGVHVAAFLTAILTSWSAGVGGMVASFVAWLMKKDESEFIRKHAAEAFNFNFSQNTEDDENGNGGDLYNGANNLEYGLAVPFKINDTITVSGYIAQSLAFNENDNGANGATDVNTRQFSTWGGAKVTFSF